MPMRMVATLMIMTKITVPMMKMSIMVRMSLVTMLMTLLPREGLNHMMMMTTMRMMMRRGKRIRWSRRRMSFRR